MSKETIRETVNTIKSVDSMKAVKVAFDLVQGNSDSITRVTEVVSMMDKNMKLLATKVLKLEKKVEELEAHVEAYANREI
jgi:predicted nuclease with TOPRIM domain